MERGFNPARGRRCEGRGEGLVERLRADLERERDEAREERDRALVLAQSMLAVIAEVNANAEGLRVRCLSIAMEQERKARECIADQIRAAMSPEAKA